MGGGLNHFDPLTDKFTQYNEEDGLPNNVVYITLEDKNGNLWLTTNWGMSKFNPASLEFINYDIRDGLQGNEFNGGAWYHADDGEMFFGGMDGLNSFIPEEIRQNDNIPRIVITKFKKFNEQEKQEFSPTGELKKAPRYRFAELADKSELFQIRCAIHRHPFNFLL